MPTLDMVGCVTVAVSRMVLPADLASVDPSESILSTRVAVDEAVAGKYELGTTRLQLPVPVVADRAEASQGGRSTTYMQI